jgi:hypothetical protein
MEHVERNMELIVPRNMKSVYCLRKCIGGCIHWQREGEIVCLDKRVIGMKKVLSLEKVRFHAEFARFPGTDGDVDGGDMILRII